jgi:hypothetical protein
MVAAFPIGLEGDFKKILGPLELGRQEKGFPFAEMVFGFFPEQRGISGEFGTKQVQVLPPRGGNRTWKSVGTNFDFWFFERRASLESLTADEGILHLLRPERKDGKIKEKGRSWGKGMLKALSRLLHSPIRRL